MKASDLSDKDILMFLSKHQGRWSTWCSGGGSMPSVADAVPKDTPVKVLRAKMAALYRRGFIGGCMCGCRGDYEITDKGLDYIGVERSVPYNGY